MTAEAKAGGINTVAIAHAAWFGPALADWVAFVRRKGTATAEEWRRSWLERLKPMPKSSNVWGAVVHVAHKRGLVHHTGRYVLARSPATHSHPVAVWAKPKATA